MTGINNKHLMQCLKLKKIKIKISFLESVNHIDFTGESQTFLHREMYLRIIVAIYFVHVIYKLPCNFAEVLKALEDR